MARSKRVVQVPKPAAGSFNKNRLLVKNTLLLNQVRHFQELEKQLPLEQRTGVKPEAVVTEGHAGEYVRKMTAILHARTGTVGGR